MDAMADVPPILQSLADLTAKQHEDHEAVVATLSSVSDENQAARAKRAEDRALPRIIWT
jgi:hypothetical protein